MQQYLITIPDNLQAKELLNYILRSNIFKIQNLDNEKKQNNDFWDGLPADVQASINKGIKQAENGQLTPHNEVMENVKAKYL